MWNPATLSLKDVSIAGQANPSFNSAKDDETTITVRGAGFVPGITLVFMHSGGGRTMSEVIPVNGVTIAPGGQFTLTGKVNAVKKTEGSYDLVAWSPSPNKDAPAGASLTSFDVTVLENAITVVAG